MYEPEPTHQIYYRKTARSTWQIFPGGNFLSLIDAEALANQLIKLVLRVEVRNTETGITEYSI